MTDELLLTKLFIPALRPSHVRRPAIVSRLDEGVALGRVLSLISAPAGYGKSSLAAEWLHESRGRVAWLSVDEGDDSLAHFLRYLLHALQGLEEPVGGELVARLRSPRLGSPESLATALINEIVSMPGTGAVRGKLILVLDDLHTVAEPAIFAFLDMLLEHAPPQLHVVMATRRDPPLALARLRARGAMTEVRQRDLRFSREEASAFMQQHLDNAPAEDEIRALNERAEGWVAGLQLAALSMRDLAPGERRRLVDGFSGRHRYILDYLTDEVLARQPAEVQRFLLHTSILQRMCGPLCDAIMSLTDGEGGQAAGQQTLERLERENLFLVRLDDERRWYRYHHLFRELLNARLREANPSVAPELHRRAAVWFEEHGHLPMAVNHALRAGEPLDAAAVVERAIRSAGTWSQVEAIELIGWLEALPAVVVAGRPWLRLFQSRCLFVVGRTDQARRSLGELTGWLEEHGEAKDAQQILLLVRMDRASYAVVDGDTRESLALAKTAMESMPEEDKFGRLRATALLALSHSRNGDVRAAEALLSDAAEQALAVGMPVAAVPLLCNRAEAEMIQGRLTEATHTCERALEMGVVEGRGIAATGFAWLQLGKIAYERDALADAERHLRLALELLASAGIADSFGNAHAVLAMVKQAQGAPTEALAEVQRAVEIAQAEGISRLVALASAYQARIWLRQGLLTQASLWAERYQRAEPTVYLREFEDASLMRVLLAQGQGANAAALVAERLPGASAAGRRYRVMELHVLRALARQQIGDEQGAVEDISRALDMGQPEGFRRLYLDEGAPMAGLLRLAWKRGVAQPLVEALMARFAHSEQPAVGKGAVAEDAAAPQEFVLVEPLTRRELEVLHGLAAGHTSKEIAAGLFLSPNTVRTHLYNLYGKLGVHSRVQAVNRGRELGLLRDRS